MSGIPVWLACLIGFAAALAALAIYCEVVRFFETRAARNAAKACDGVTQGDTASDPVGGNPQALEIQPPLSAPEGLETVPPPPQRYPFWTYLDLAFFIVLAVPSFLLAMLLVMAVLWIFPPSAHTKVIGLLAAQFVGWGFWFTGLYGLLKMKYGRPFWRSLAWQAPPEGWASGAIRGFVLAMSVLLLAVLLRTPNTESPMKDLLGNPFSVMLIAIFGTTLGPVCEELAFRGFLLPLLTRSAGAAGGIVLTALPFALLHGSEYAWSWPHLVLIFVAGVAFGWMRWRSGSTAAAALMHATYNLTFFIGFAFQNQLGTSH
jgi:membrane protease YdiL (CAAX protease family)